MKREESKRILKLVAMLIVVHGASTLLMPILPIYGLNTLITALPYGYLLCEYMDDSPRMGMLFTVILLSALPVLALSLRMFGVFLLAGFCGELAYMFAQRKKEAIDCKISLITTFNTLLYPLLILWEMLATEGASSIMMTDFTIAIVLFVVVHVLGFVGIKLSLKEKAEWH